MTELRKAAVVEMRASCIARIESAMRRRKTMLKANPGSRRAYWRSLSALRIIPESEACAPPMGVPIQDQDGKLVFNQTGATGVWTR
jgi:hypothetical protein